MKNKPIHMVKTITNEKLNKYAREWKHNENKIEALCIAQNDENWKHIENEIEVLCMAQDEINKLFDKVDQGKILVRVGGAA